ncbi:MAG: hypothetical protein U0169_03780 [Polyangiaceae bacterium]
MNRRELLALLATSVPFASIACSPRPASFADEKGEPHAIEPLASLLVPVGLRGFVEFSPRSIADSVDLLPAIATLVPEERFDAFRDRNAGIDLRRLDEVVWADYGATSLILARGSFDVRRIVREFDLRARGEVTKFVTRTKSPAGATFDPLVTLEDRGDFRSDGRPGGAKTDASPRRAATLFGARALAFETGPPGPMRAAALFAERRLKRSRPALAVPPLDEAAKRTPSGIVRAFAAGPFDETWQPGLGGLLASASAASLAVRVEPKGQRPPRLHIGLRVFGAWGDAAGAAGTRLRAWADTFADSAFGRLLELEGPVHAAELASDRNSLTLEGSFDSMALARGIRAATSAQIDEVVR